MDEFAVEVHTIREAPCCGEGKGGREKQSESEDVGYLEWNIQGVPARVRCSQPIPCQETKCSTSVAPVYFGYGIVILWERMVSEYNEVFRSRNY